MEKQINWGLKMSLEQMTLRRVLANIWMEFDILALIEKYRSEHSINVWRETVENKVKLKVSKLMLPESLKNQMMYLVRSMGLDILNWKEYLQVVLSLSYLNMCTLKQLCWTYTGVIDYQNTAERLVRLEIFEEYERYYLASLYCLVDYIPEIWNQIPEILKGVYYNGKYSRKLKSLDMNQYWPFILNGEESQLYNIFRRKNRTSFCQYAFRHAAREGNKVATKWFFEKLSRDERDSSLFRAVRSIIKIRRINVSRSFKFPIEKISDVLSYLLSQMSPEEQMKILKRYPCDVLRCFLNYPWHDFFLEIADVIWTFLPESGYGELLLLLIRNIKNTDNYSPNFLYKFFLRCPKNLKKIFLNRYNYMFSKFLKAEDIDAIKVIFRNVDVEDRVRFISSYATFKCLDRLIMTDKWYLVQLCLKEATLAEEEMERLKEDFMRFHNGITTREMMLRKRKWRIFFQRFEANFNSLNRGKENLLLSKAKKRCIK